VDALVAALGDDDGNVRDRAAGSLGQLGQASPSVVRALVDALSDDEIAVRDSAAGSLGQLGQASLPVVEALVAALGDDEVVVRYRAAGSLGRLSQTSPSVVDALMAALGDDEVAVRYRAAGSLGQLGQASPQVVGMLLEALQKASNWSVRRDAGRLLGQFGAAKESFILALWRGLLDMDKGVRTACAEALARLGRRFPEAAGVIAAKLVQAIRDPKFDKPDVLTRRSGHDYAFEGLWLLVSGGEGEEDEGR
jgi:HEAT repeat protein